MLRLYQDFELIKSRRIALLAFADHKGLYPDREVYKELLSERMNVYDIRGAMLRCIIYLRELCEKKKKPEMIKELFQEAGWSKDDFDWMEIDPETSIGIEPSSKEEEHIHLLRTSYTCNYFFKIPENERTQRIHEIFVYQTPAFQDMPASVVKDKPIISPEYLTWDMVVYIIRYCSDSLARALLKNYTGESTNTLLCSNKTAVDGNKTPVKAPMDDGILDNDITITWTADDVTGIAKLVGIDMSTQQAVQWLHTHGSTLQKNISNYAYDVTKQMLKSNI